MDIETIIKSLNKASHYEQPNQSNQSNQIIFKIPTKEQLILMLLEEEKIRFSQEYISECNDVALEPNGWLRVSAEKQYKVARQFGFISEIEADIAVNHMRRARYLYPEEKLFQTIPVYVRNNLAEQCKYKVGDTIPNLMIHQLNTQLVNLYDTFDSNKINILIASSHT